jgi:Protein of unknown function (DUF2892)
MKSNVGELDRTIRIFAGVVLIGLATTHVIDMWGWIGAVPFLTGIFRFCPLYALLDMSTCPSDKK